MKRIKYINESENNIVVKIIGDHIANMVDNSDDYLTSDINTKNMSVNVLINKLRNMMGKLSKKSRKLVQICRIN